MQIASAHFPREPNHPGKILFQRHVVVGEYFLSLMEK